MAALDKLVDRRIEEAIARGEFEDLDGRGSPVDLSEDAMVPEDLRLAHRVLKNAGFVPEELSLRREINEIRDGLAATRDPEERRRALARLDLLTARLDARRCHDVAGASGAAHGYRDGLIRRLSR